MPVAILDENKTELNNDTVVFCESNEETIT